jgi:hypothetical protein
MRAYAPILATLDAPEVNNRRVGRMSEISSLRAASLDGRALRDPERLHRAASRFRHPQGSILVPELIS